MIVELYAQTDIGRVRRGNEDNFLVLDISTAKAWMGLDSILEPPLELRRFEIGSKGLALVVSDGMGGALAGDVASRMAVEIVHDLLTKSRGEESEDQDVPFVKGLLKATTKANNDIHHRSLVDIQCTGMGATLTGAVVRGDKLGLVQVGDSRAYVLREREIKLVTKDQSLVQHLVDIGQITKEEAETHMFRNVILQALGAQRGLTPAVGHIALRQGDMLLLCSDGLSGKLRDEEMHTIVEAAGDLAAATSALIEEANRRGGEDNITVVLARFTGDDIPPPGSEKIIVETTPDKDTQVFDKAERITKNL